MESAVLDKAPAFSIQDEVIDAMERDFMVLAVDDPTDKQQIAVVREARLEVRKARIAVENRRKELKEDALRYGQKVDAEARRIKERLEPIEAHLQFHEDAAKREAERVAKEAEAKRQAKIRERLDLLAAADCRMPSAEIESLADAEFDAMLVEQQTLKQERDAQAAREAEERRLEAERLKAEREEAERVRREAAKPDADKLLAFAEVIRALEAPTLTEANQRNYSDVRNAVESLANYVKEIGADIAAGRI